MRGGRTLAERRKRKQKRRRLLVANALLLAAVIAVGVWNALEARQGGEDGRLAGLDVPGESETSEGEHAASLPAGSAGESAPSAEESPAEPVAGPPEGQISASGDASSGSSNESAGSGESGEPIVTLAFAGDILLGEYVGVLLEKNGYDYPYEHVRDMLRKADVAAANLETAVTGPAEKPGLKTYEFRSDPAVLPAFADAGFDLVSLANNHSMDFGPQGLLDTMSHLDDNGILHIGAGKDADSAYEPVYIEKNGIRMAYLGFSRVIPFVEWKAGKGQIGLAESYDYRRPVEAIKAAKEAADLVVVLVHWGEERMLEPDPLEQVDLGRRYVDAGADLVVGTHPHVLQGFERYKDRWIVYSLGNFIFTKSKEPLTYDSGILEANCSRDGACGLKLTPFFVDTPQPVPMKAERAADVFARLASVSYGATVNESGEIIPVEQERR